MVKKKKEKKNEAVSLSRLFIQRTHIVQTQRQRRSVIYLRVMEAAMLWALPLVVAVLIQVPIAGLLLWLRLVRSGTNKE
jgi:hypothetical protein